MKSKFKARKLEFRVWDGSRLFYSENLNRCPFIINGRHAIALILNGFDIDEEGDTAITQFTGMRDKTKKKIFEGDIVKFLHHLDQKPRAITFLNGTFTYQNTWYDYDGILYPEECEIIGNVFENPDLLK